MLGGQDVRLRESGGRKRHEARQREDSTCKLGFWIAIFITIVFSDNYDISIDLAEDEKREPLPSLLSDPARNRLYS